MPAQQAGAFQDLMAVAGPEGQLAGHCEQRLLVDHTWPQQPGRRDAQIQHCRFDADLRLAAVHDQGDFMAQMFAHVLSVGRGNAIGWIRAGRGQREIALTDDRLDQGMAWPAHSHREAACGDDIRNRFCARQHQRERSRPERPRQPLRHLRPMSDAAFRHGHAGDMDDDGVVCRAPFNLEEALDGGRVQRVRRQAIDCFRRERHHLACAQQFRRAPHRRLE